MKYTDYFAFLVDEIHSVIAATVDENGLPVTCAIDIMDWDENGLYFLTAKGKNFYHRLKRQKYIALTGVKGEDTMSSTALSIGGKVTELEDGLEIEGVGSLNGGEVDSFNDHRIAMSMAVAATRCTSPLKINGAECVSKSYPDFFEVYESIGGEISREP